MKLSLSRRVGMLAMLPGLAVALALALALSAGDARSQVLAQYQFTADTSASGTAANAVASVFATNHSAYIGRSGGGLNFFFGRSDSTSAANSGVSASAAAALGAGDFASFTLAATAGNRLDLSQLTFNYGAGTGATSAAPFDANLFVQVSTDGVNFSAVGTTLTYHAAGAGLATTNTPSLATIDLSAYQNIASTMTFRIYGYISNVTTSAVWSAADTIRLDNIAVNGAVVPEPSTAFLALLGLFAGLGLRRFRRAATS